MVQPRPAVSLCAVPGQWAVCQLPAGSPLPPALLEQPSTFVSVTQTPGETSVVCELGAAPAGARIEEPLSVFLVEGTLAFSRVGVLHDLSGPLAAAHITVFVISTYKTDYLLVPAGRASEAAQVWRLAGYRVTDADASPG